MAVKCITDIDIYNKRVLFRFDFNVPLDTTGAIKDDTRIRRALPTIKYAIGKGARLVLTSHLGRPKGEIKPELSLKPVASRLSELLSEKVAFIDDCVGPKVQAVVNALEPGDVVLLENVRFHPEETKNDPKFSAELAKLADVYINDAFGTAHRAHCSTVGIAEMVKEKGTGLLMKEELENLGKAFSDPKKPVVGILGGAKVSDKISVLKNILNKMDVVLIGGGMANTFLKAKGLEVGLSLTEEDMIQTAKEIMERAIQTKCLFCLPEDAVVAPGIENGQEARVVQVKNIGSKDMVLDIGPATVKKFTAEIEKAATIVWNGPMGVFEKDAFKQGTMNIAKAVASSKAYSVVGGGDSVRAVAQAGVSDEVSYISTGGGAFMEFMEGKILPGVAALES
ncbi:MAG: phosphoglycerate kinase [Deltaproteobacteria bacterium]|nr:phosphoglycerate kinase [Deltaproteobacteria bacterium]